MREYMYLKVPALDFNSDSESEDVWNTDLDYDDPESNLSFESECSDTYTGSEGESEEYSSDEEDYSQGHHDHSSEYSENDEISNLDSDGCTSESDSMDPDSEEYSESECDDVYDSE
jgi:hypothetical protein